MLSTAHNRRPVLTVISNARLTNASRLVRIRPEREADLCRLRDQDWLFRTCSPEGREKLLQEHGIAA